MMKFIFHLVAITYGGAQSLLPGNLYKKIEAEIWPQIEENVWAELGTSSGSAKFNLFF